MIKNIFAKTFAVVALFLLFFSGCGKKTADNTVWIYTSLYPEVIAKFEKAFQEKFPDIEVKWFQNGSENVNAKLAIEEQAGKVKADLVMTADIFWYRKKAEQGFFEPYKPAMSFEMPAQFKDARDHYYTQRISTMVIAYNKKFVPDEDAPKSFTELALSKWKGKVAVGSPLESGTNFMLMNSLIYRYGYDFLQKLRDNDIMSAGGNSAVMQRIVSGERPVGMVILENVLSAQRTNPNIGFVYPSDGAVLIPGPIAIVKSSTNKEAAKKLYDYFLTEDAQKFTVSEFAYVTHPNAGQPEGTKPLKEILPQAFELSEKFFDFVQKEEGQFKTKYSDIMF